MKRTLRIFGVVLVLLALIAVALPFLLDANQFRPLLQARLSEALGRDVTLGGLQLSIFSGSITASDLAIADDPAFGKTPFLRAKTIAIGVEMMPLILSRKLNVTRLSIQTPEIELIQGSAGSWNFSSLGAKSKPVTPNQAPAASSSPTPAPSLSVNLVKISEGRVTIEKIGNASKPLVLDDVNLQLTGYATAASFPFTLTVDLPGNGAVKLDGKAGPIVQGDVDATPFSANLRVNHLDLVLSGMAAPSAGLAGLASIDGAANSSNSAVTITGKVKAEQLKLVKVGLPAKLPAEVDFALTHDLKKRTGELSHADIHLGKAMATLSGTYNIQREPPYVDMKLVGHGLDVTQIAAFFPALNIVLPAGASIEQGTADLNFAAQGPADKLVTTGRVDLENTKLAKFDLASKMKVLGELAGIKAEPTTSIQSLSANVKVARDGTQVQNVNLVIPAIGTLTGAGFITPEHNLDFKMRVAARGNLAAVARIGSKEGIPFTIQGTSSDPVFRPDLKGLVSDQLKDFTSGRKSVNGVLDGLFGRKKQR